MFVASSVTVTEPVPTRVVRLLVVFIQKSNSESQLLSLHKYPGIHWGIVVILDLPLVYEPVSVKVRAGHCLYHNKLYASS